MNKFEISLAQWSLHRALQNNTLSHLDFPAFTRKNFDLGGVDYVNCFFKSTDSVYIRELKQRCDDHGIESLLIMCDGLGKVGDPSEEERIQTVENHLPWLEAAANLGCHSIRVNAESEGSFEEQMNNASAGLALLSEKASEFDLNVIVENHWGLSSNGEWLSGVMKKVNKVNCGTLPDFGNFDDYDKYQGVEDMMPWAKSVSAKTYEFSDSGEETKIDYERMLRVVFDSNFSGWLGVEYEGDKHSEVEGIAKTIELLKRFQ